MELVELMSRLNAEQRPAAEDIYGPSMIVAGPGSGKTYTLVVRTANMIKQGVPANKIILFTFTKKAAMEIKERVVAAIGPEANAIMVGTYHSVCSRFLRKYAGYIGLTKSFSIFDTEDCKKLIKEIIKTAGYNYESSKVLWKISDYKSKLITPSEALRNSSNTIEKQHAELYQIYYKRMLEQNAVDFDDLIYKTVRLLQQYPEVKAELNREYQYIVAELIGPYCGDAVCVPL